MIHPEYKVVNDKIFLSEGGRGLQSKTRIKFVQNEDAVALYDGTAYVGQFVSSTGDKITLDENKNVIIPSGTGSGIDLNKLKESDSVKIEKNTDDRTATFSVTDKTEQFLTSVFLGSGVYFYSGGCDGRLNLKLVTGRYKPGSKTQNPQRGTASERQR